MVDHAQGMFIGETLCLLAFKVGLLCAVAKRPVSGRPDSFSPFIFALPALCDCLATSTMYLGLTMTVLISKKISAYNDIYPSLHAAAYPHIALLLSFRFTLVHRACCRRQT